MPTKTFFKSDDSAQTFSVCVERYYHGCDLSDARCYLKAEFADGATDKFDLESSHDSTSVTVFAPVTARMQRTEGVAKLQLSFEADSFVVQSDVFDVPVARAIDDAICEYEERSPAAFNELVDRVDELSEQVESCCEGLSDVESQVEELSANVNAESKTYAQLKALKTAGKLVAGTRYRITDFVTMTNPSLTDVSGAGHPFDLIVTAISGSEFSENAEACLHDGDTYFLKSDLGAWKIKYCFDNDNERYEWANASSGRGVIFYMKDEWGNECSYDFKNVLFARYKRAQYTASDAGLTPYGITSGSVPWRVLSEQVASGFMPSFVTNTALTGDFFDTLGTSEIFPNSLTDSASVFDYHMTTVGQTTDYVILNLIYVNTSNSVRRYTVKLEGNATSTKKWFYTFSSLNGVSLTDGATVYDASVLGSAPEEATVAYGNVIKPYFEENGLPFMLNGVVLIDDVPDNCFGNFFDRNCRNVTAGNDFSLNKIGAGCRDLIFGNSCRSNVIGNDCYNVYVGRACENNVIESSVSDVTMLNECEFVKIGSSCRYLTIGSNCSAITFGEKCTYCILISESTSVKIGKSCNNIYVCASSERIDIAASCRNIWIAPGCSSLSFGDGCAFLYLKEEGTCSLKTYPLVCGLSARVTLKVDAEVLLDGNFLRRLYRDSENNYVIEWNESLTDTAFVFKNSSSAASWESV